MSGSVWTLLSGLITLTCLRSSISGTCMNAEKDDICRNWAEDGLCVARPSLPMSHCRRACNASYYCPGGWPSPDLVPNCAQLFQDGLGDSESVQRNCPTTWSLVNATGLCPVFPDPGFPHTTISTLRRNPYTTVKFLCNSGYENLANPRVYEHTCNFSAKWQANKYEKYRSPPDCQPVCNDTRSNCSENVTMDQCYFNPGSMWIDCAEMCDTPALCKPSLGDESTSCGEWAKGGECEHLNGSTRSKCPYTCGLREQVACPDPPEVPGTVVSGGRRYMETVTYRCIGDDTGSTVGGLRVCSRNGTWIRSSNTSGDDPLCPTSYVVSSSTPVEGFSTPVVSTDLTSALETSNESIARSTSTEEASPASSDVRTSSTTTAELSSPPVSTSPLTYSSLDQISSSSTVLGASTSEQFTEINQSPTPRLEGTFRTSNGQYIMPSTSDLESSLSIWYEMTPTTRSVMTPSASQANPSYSIVASRPSAESTTILTPSNFFAVSTSHLENDTISIEPFADTTVQYQSSTSSSSEARIQSTPSTSTEATATQSTTPKVCRCRCSLPSNGTLMETTLLEIRRKLTLNKTTLSAHRRRYVSMPDQRWSAVSTGSIGVVIIIGSFLFFVIADALKALTYVVGKRKKRKSAPATTPPQA